MLMTKVGLEFIARNRANTQINSFNRSIQRMGRQMLAVAGMGGGIYAITRGLRGAISEAISFEMQMAKVSTMLDKQTMRYMPAYSKQMEDLAVKYGEGTETLSKGLYDILSATIAPRKAMKLLETSLRSAKGGFTQTAIATTATVRILKAYNWEAEEAIRVNDILHATVRKGIMDFEGLSSSIGDVIGLAAYLDIDLEAVGASLASMSRSLTIDKAVVALKNILNQFKYPTEAARQAAGELGFALDETSIKGKGLVTIIQKLSKAEARHLEVLMPSLRGLVGFAGQLKNVASVTDNYEYILDSAGLQQEAFEKAINTTDTAVKRLWQSFKLLGAEIGKTALVKKGAGTLTGFLNGLRQEIGYLQEDIPKFIELWKDPWATQQDWKNLLLPPAAPTVPAGPLLPSGEDLIQQRAIERGREQMKVFEQNIKAAKSAVAITAEEIKTREKAIEKARQMIRALEYEYEIRGLIDEERERSVEMARFEAEAIIAYGEGTREATAAMEEHLAALNKLIEGRRDFSAFRHELGNWARKATNLWGNLGRVTTSALDGMADTMATALLKGEDVWKSFAQTVIFELTRMIIRMQMAQALMWTLGGIGGGAPAGIPVGLPTRPSTVGPTLVPTGGGPSLQHGGMVLETGLAKVHRGEIFSGVQGGGMGKTDIHIHNEGSEKLEISSVEEYMISDRRIVDVTLQAMTHDYKFQGAIKSASR